MDLDTGKEMNEIILKLKGKTFSLRRVTNESSSINHIFMSDEI